MWLLPHCLLLLLCRLRSRVLTYQRTCPLEVHRWHYRRNLLHPDLPGPLWPTHSWFYTAVVDLSSQDQMPPGTAPADKLVQFKLLLSYVNWNMGFLLIALNWFYKLRKLKSNDSLLFAIMYYPKVSYWHRVVASQCMYDGCTYISCRWNNSSAGIYTCIIMVYLCNPCQEYAECSCLLSKRHHAVEKKYCQGNHYFNYDIIRTLNENITIITENIQTWCGKVKDWTICHR